MHTDAGNRVRTRATLGRALAFAASFSAALGCNPTGCPGLCCGKGKPCQLASQPGGRLFSPSPSVARPQPSHPPQNHTGDGPAHPAIGKVNGSLFVLAEKKATALWFPGHLASGFLYLGPPLSSPTRTSFPGQPSEPHAMRVTPLGDRTLPSKCIFRHFLNTVKINGLEDLCSVLEKL